ncbi:hypothetical protein [Microbispora sp. CA-102843]
MVLDLPVSLGSEHAAAVRHRAPVPYADLPPQERAKDDLFKAIVTALLRV